MKEVIDDGSAEGCEVGTHVFEKLYSYRELVIPRDDWDIGREEIITKGVHGKTAQTYEIIIDDKGNVDIKVVDVKVTKPVHQVVYRGTNRPGLEIVGREENHTGVHSTHSNLQYNVLEILPDGFERIVGERIDSEYRMSQTRYDYSDGSFIIFCTEIEDFVAPFSPVQFSSVPKFPQ